MERSVSNPPLPPPLAEFLAARPWLTTRAELPGDPVGMLGDQESALFQLLARDVFAGRGAIVDAGSFLGRSASCFATGLRRNPAFRAERDRVHCFDKFRVNGPDTVRFLRDRLKLGVCVGDSTRPIFDAQVAPVSELLVVHAGDFHATVWDGGPIEILMVDIAKLPTLLGRLVEQMFPQLIPGHSLVVHQDYHHPWLPHIHVVMEYLAESFELLVPQVDDSALFRCIAPVPPDRLLRASAYDFTKTERIDLMAAAIARLPQEQRHSVAEAQVLQLAWLGETTAARKAFAELDALAQSPGASRHWLSQHRAVADHLEDRELAALIAAHEWPAALARVDASLERRGPGAKLLAHRGRALLELGRTAEALVAVRAAATSPDFAGTQSGDPEFWVLEARAQAAHGDRSAARASLGRALSCGLGSTRREELARRLRLDDAPPSAPQSAAASGD